MGITPRLGNCDANPARIYVAGHSAGGHLTATAMSLGAVKGGLAISGLYDGGRSRRRSHCGAHGWANEVRERQSASSYR
jgi:acetyl esterase/lipase